MKKNFAILGLHPDATKEQVKAAYEKRLSRYRQADYADDPDYVRRKTVELKEAFEKAYAVAGTQAAYGEERSEYERSRPSTSSGASRESRSSGESGAARSKIGSLREAAVSKTGPINQAKRYVSPTGGGKVIGAVLGLIIIFVSLGITTCQNIDDAFYDDDYSSHYGYSYEFLTERENQVFQAAIDAANMMYSSDYDWEYEDEGYTEEELRMAADEFINNYLQMESLEEVIPYLRDEYGDEFTATLADDLYTQVSEVLMFYGFDDPIVAEGYTDTYSGERMTNIKMYLDFLNSFYEDYDFTI